MAKKRRTRKPFRKTNEEVKRKHRDLYHFVQTQMARSLNGKSLFRYAAVLEMAREKFYMSPSHIMRVMRVMRSRVPDPEDRSQIKMDI